MRRALFALLLMGLFAAAFSAGAATGRIIKVLPQFLDLHGRNSLSPSLYDRDAYQVYLREHPKQRSGLRFAIQWKSHGPVYGSLRLRVEMRGTAPGNQPTHLVLQKTVKSGGWFSHWTSMPLTGAKYRKFGTLTAWRVTLWEGSKLLGQQRSFLW